MIETSFPDWLIYLTQAIAILYGMIAAGIAIGKTGRHPLWALLLLIPYAQIVGIWLLAYSLWPNLDKKEA